jgi:hypothetical protein
MIDVPHVVVLRCSLPTPHSNIHLGWLGGFLPVFAIAQTASVLDTFPVPRVQRVLMEVAWTGRGPCDYSAIKGVEEE